MQRLFTVFHALGLMLVVFSTAYLVPMAASWIYADGTLIDFALAMVMTASAGALMWMLTRRYKGELSIRHGYLLVVGMWTAMPAVATLPLLLVIDGLSFTDAYFEAMSGITTTGATTLTGLDFLPPAINIWRHELNWLGGMGIIVLAVAILPLLGVGGRQLFKAETPGPMKDSSLTPRIAETARNLWAVYVGVTLTCALSLKWAGMNWLDAVCHSFSAMGLGGFSTHDASIGYFHSPLIEFVLIVFMLIAVINFATHFLALRAWNFKPYKGDAEAMASLVLILSSCLVVTLFLWWQGTYPNFLTTLRYVSFNLISIATSSGYASTDYNQWPIFAPMWMMFLACIAASSGSAGGGIKMMRTLVLVKQAGREFLRLLHPAVINPMKIGGRVVPNSIVFAVLGFIFLYFMTTASLVFILLISGMDFISAFSAILACINNFGPGLGSVGPASNYHNLSDFQTWVCAFGMLVGRLEIFTLLILFTPHFWRRQIMEAIQDDIDQELLPLFLEEADELCPQITELLQAWHEQPVNSQLARKLQRTLHTLKGSARMSGAMRVGELVHHMEEQVTEARQTPSFWDELRNRLDGINEAIGHLRADEAGETAEPMQEESVQQHMPFASISKRLYRIVRQSCKDLGKKANLELHGTEIELAGSVLERMTAPFEHLLRNAIAHGLESPQQREASGKHPVGDIRLSLQKDNNEAVFEFADDGAGLDIDGLRRKALEKGLLKSDEEAHDSRIMQLIFAPGLSTATVITPISGRGVGMDVVRSEVVALGGRISVLSKPGEGVRFTIRLPHSPVENRGMPPG